MGRVVGLVGRPGDAVRGRGLARSRSEKLLQFLDEADVALNGEVRVAEFGCGVNAPFHQLCVDRPGFSVRKFDLQAWDADTRVLDLNRDPFPSEHFDITTFSGVLEYLDDVRGVLLAAARASEVVLFSYACLPKGTQGSNEAMIDVIKNRVVVDGWRSHYTLETMISLASEIGLIVNIGHWRGQVLIVLKSDREAAATATTLG